MVTWCNILEKKFLQLSSHHIDSTFLSHSRDCLLQGIAFFAPIIKLVFSATTNTSLTFFSVSVLFDYISNIIVVQLFVAKFLGAQINLSGPWENVSLLWQSLLNKTSLT